MYVVRAIIVAFVFNETWIIEAHYTDGLCLNTLIEHTPILKNF